MCASALASGPSGGAAVRPLVDCVLGALEAGGRERGGPLPVGGPEAVAALVRDAVGEVLPEEGDPGALEDLVRVLPAGAADPADPLCAAHLHCPPLAVAVAADLAVSVLNPSLDSWDQSPSASTLEELVTGALARLAGMADALVTSGGTEANQLAVLLAREVCGPGVRLMCGANAHHSLARAAWLFGLAEPVVVPASGGVVEAAALEAALSRVAGPVLVAATAGTTDAGLIDPLPEVAALCARYGARLHVDAAYGGGLLFSDRYRGLLAGLEAADSVALDLHKLGWQPVAAGVFAVRDGGDLAVLGQRADYLSAADDVEAGLPDLLGRSLRTTRRADVFKVAVTLRVLGRAGLGSLVDGVCAGAREFAGLVAGRPGFELYGLPVISTVVFRPSGVGDDIVAEVRRRLLVEGRAVLGRARLGGRLWFKVTLLNPHVRLSELAGVLCLVEGHLR